MFSKKYRKECFYKIFERFAFYGNLIKRNNMPTIWVHCASLGEVRAIEPILDSLKLDNNIVLTTITKTGREYAQEIKKANYVFLLPIDAYPMILKAFNTINPDMLIIVETELWPTLLYTAFKKNIKVVTINGRMSRKAFRIYKNLKFFWGKFVSLISTIIARSNEDADRFKSLLVKGINEIIVSGNIKYDRNFSVNFHRADLFLKEEDFVFTAGSIREGEEEIIADVYNKIRSEFENIKFFLALRHLTRLKDTIKIFENKNIEYSLFSSKNFKNSFILVDVFGILQEIYSISDVCYVGGSMVDMGGQNPVEPAGLAKPVIFGRYMDNFMVESETLVKNRGALIVQDSNDLANKIKKFILNRQVLKIMGQNALKTVECQKGAVAFTIQTIKNKLYVR
jgi:3-deoxy-D-manno-octulosonic-acid transferase